MIELLRGDAEAAEVAYRSSCDSLELMGQAAYLATYATGLAEALCEQGDLSDAEHWAQIARSHSSARDVSAEFSWRYVLAKVLARQGAVDEAETLARAARELVERTDALNQRGNVLLALAEVLRSAGRTDEATAVVDDAIAAFTEKGNVVSAARGSELKEALVPA